MQPMVRPTLRLIRANDAILQRREFDDLARIDQPRISTDRIELHEIPQLLEFAAREVPAMSSAVDVVARVAEHNRDSVWVFRRRSVPVGVYAMLHLSKDGLEELLIGEMNMSVPDRRSMVPTGDAPAAIYKSAAVAPGLASAGICAISRMLQSPQYAHANLFARPTTMGGERIMANLGFYKVRSGLSDLHRYVRFANRYERSVEAA